MTSKFLVVITITLFFFSCSKANKIIFIADANEDCIVVNPQECTQFKEQGDSDWKLLHDEIEGFTYEKGFFYKLKVETKKIDNPSGNGPSLHYKLIEILDKSRAPLLLDQGSWLVTRLNDTDSFGRNPFIKIDLSQNEINGNTSCNRFSGKISVKNNNVEISELSYTEMMCRDVEVEKAFLDALKSISSYTLNEEKLQLFGENQQLLIECDYLKYE